MASGVGGIRAQVIHGRTGLLVDGPTDLWKFAELVVSAVHGDVDKEAIGDQARQRVLEHFLPDAEVHTMARILTDS